MHQPNHMRLVSPDHPTRRDGRFLEVNNTNSGGTLRCEVVSDFRELEKVAADWERLWQSDCRAEIFQTFAWARAWWQSYGHDRTLCCAIVFEGDKIVGILPLVRRGRIVQFLGMPEADYTDLLCEEGREKEVLTVALEALFQSVKDWDECILQHLAKDGRVVRHCQALPRNLRRRMKLVPAGRYQTILLEENREEIFNLLWRRRVWCFPSSELKISSRFSSRRIV